jgi:DNA-binding NarL/FixJ family response regulator
MVTRLLLVDDQRLTRNSVKQLIELEKDMEVIGCVDEGMNAVEAARRFQPDVVVMDVMMPTVNGIDATKAILGEHPKMKVLGLSMYSDRRFVDGMLVAGASGYVLKDCVFEELVEAIRHICSGKQYLSSKLKYGTRPIELDHGDTPS